MLGGRGDKVRQFVGAISQVFQVEYAFGQSTKESRHSIFQNFTARAQQSSIRIKLASQRNEIALVSARAMQKQECARRFAGNKLVNEIRTHRSLVNWSWP